MNCASVRSSGTGGRVPEGDSSSAIDTVGSRQKAALDQRTRSHRMAPAIIRCIQTCAVLRRSTCDLCVCDKSGFGKTVAAKSLKHTVHR